MHARPDGTRRRRPALAASLLCLLLFGCSTGRGTEPAEERSPALDPSGGLRFDDPVFAFGSAYQNQRLDHVFRFVNTAVHPVRITKVKPTCGCTIPRYTSDPVEPGETGTIDLTLETGSLTGDVTKKLTVFTDTDEEPLELVVTGRVEIELWIEPDQTDLGPLYPGRDPEPRRVRIAWLPRTEVEVTSLETTSPTLRIAERVPFEEDGAHGIDLTVEVRDWERELEEAHTHLYRHFLVVRTDHPRYRQATHPVQGERVKPIRAVPRVLNFGLVRGDREVVKRLRLEPGPGYDLSVKGFDAPEYFELTTEPDASRGAAVIAVKLLAGAPSGRFRDALTVRTNLEEEPLVTVYAMGTKRDR